MDLNLVFMALEGKHNLIRELGTLYFGLKFNKPVKSKDTVLWFKDFAAKHNEAWKLKHG